MEYADIIHRCFRCGYCKFTRDYRDFNCPTYRKFWFETYSPGGRMWLLRAWLNGEVQSSKRLAEIFYSCVTCGNCVEHCALEFRDDLVDIFVAARGEMVEKGLVLPPVRDYLKNIRIHGNPFKEPREERARWADGLGIEQYAGQEYLLYIGCVGSYDERGTQVARAVASVLKKAGLSAGILGEKEPCDGNEVRLLGESELFNEMARQNIELLNRLDVKKIVALSPHSYNAFKNEYRDLGGKFEVLHYTEVLDRLAEKGKVSFSGLNATVTYHDPCYLGRHNGVFDAPRNVLRAVPGLALVEMSKTQKNALCCGGGGGNFFTDIIGSGEGAPGRDRIREAIDTGAEVVATACPQCAKMLQDAAKSEGAEDRIKVMDIAEIVEGAPA